MFTTLDLSVISNSITYKLSANITALQLFEPLDLNAESFYAGFNYRRRSEGKSILKYKPVINLYLFNYYINYLLII